MADDTSSHDYTYPNTSDDPDQKNVLRNKFGLRSQEALSRAEYRITSNLIAGMELGLGPRGTFDAGHLKAIHRYLFSDVYEWAGHTRDERPVIDGARVEAIGVMSKGETIFLHGSRIGMGIDEAMRPIANSDALRGTTGDAFAVVAARVLSDLNFVHPFREGNGRTQEAFISELARHTGHYVDFSVTTKPVMIAASVAAMTDPDNLAMRRLVEDAVDPGRVRALKETFAHLREQGESPYDHDVRAARPGETLSGAVIGKGSVAASLVTQQGIVAVPLADISRQQLGSQDDITVKVRTSFAPDQRTATADRSEARPNQAGRTYWQRAADNGNAIQLSERQAREREGKGAEESQPSRTRSYRPR